MFGKILSTAIIISALWLTVNAQTENKIAETKVLNGAAQYLPKPDYPQEAKDICADGIVNVEVTIDEKGDVVSAEAVSGDELLRDSAVEAAKKAKFSQKADGVPVKVKGIIVYNFVAEKTCFKKGVVNEKAIFLPPPEFPKSCRCGGQVIVQIVVDESGKVVRAVALSGHPLLRAESVKAAQRAKFPPTLINSGPIKIKALLVYKFSSDENLVGKPVKLAKPLFVSCTCRFAKKDYVIVQAEIDEQGNIIKAVAVSGHPFLKMQSELAARASKFSQTKALGIPVKANAVIVYQFASTGKWTAKLTNLTVNRVEAEKQ